MKICSESLEHSSDIYRLQQITAEVNSQLVICYLVIKGSGFKHWNCCSYLSVYFADSAQYFQEKFSRWGVSVCWHPCSSLLVFMQRDSIRLMH